MQCAICQDSFKEPVLIEDGTTYCRECITAWFRKCAGQPRSPATNLALSSDRLIPNLELYRALNQKMPAASSWFLRMNARETVASLWKVRGVLLFFLTLVLSTLIFMTVICGGSAQPRPFLNRAAAASALLQLLFKAWSVARSQNTRSIYMYQGTVMTAIFLMYRG